jgi:hypothetical protein
METTTGPHWRALFLLAVAFVVAAVIVTTVVETVLVRSREAWWNEPLFGLSWGLRREHLLTFLIYGTLGGIFGQLSAKHWR